MKYISRTKIEIGLYLFFISIMIYLVVQTVNSISNNKVKTVEVVKYKEKIVYKKPTNVIISITKKDLEEFLKYKYNFISNDKRELILKSLEKASERYNINPLVLAGLIATESSFRWWKTHSTVVINGKRDNGIGLGGIVYLWWGEALKKAKIIQTKADLYDIDKNIMAIGYILNENKKKKLKKGTTDRTTSALRYYFGKNYKTYSQKIKNRIAEMVLYKILK